MTELVNQDVGHAAAFTGFLCDVYRKGDGRYCDEHNTHLILRSNVQSPVEVSVTDVLIRRGTYGDNPLSFHAESWNMAGQKEPHIHERDALFTDDPAAYLGGGPEALHTTDYPRYVEMFGYVLGWLGWDANEFEAYRYRLQYPVMPSAIVVKTELPEKPV